MVVQAPLLVQKPAQQSAHGSPKAQEAGQASQVPVQVSPQFPEVLQLLPQQTSPATQVESSLQGQPKPAQPSARASGGAVRERPPTRAAAVISAWRSVARREPVVASMRVQ
jgi:hypothetical protein